MAWSDAWSSGMTGIGSLLSAPNDATGGIYGLMVFGILWVIMFVVFVGSSRNEKQSLLASSLIMVPAGAYLTILEVVDPTINILPPIMAVVGFLAMSKEND